MVSGDGGSRTRSSSVQARHSAVRASSPAFERDAGVAANQPQHLRHPLQHRLDDGVPCGQSGGDAMSAVAHDVDLALTCEMDRRGLAALLEPLSVPLARRLADAPAATVTDPNLDKGPQMVVVKRSFLFMLPPFGSTGR
jgi:hypothetical protein